MRKRPAEEDVKSVINTNKEVFYLRLKLAKLKKSPSFMREELEKVLRSLKTGKSRDPENWICEIFKEGVLGEDLKNFLVMMFNRMKSQVTIPEAHRTANITNIHTFVSNSIIGDVLS